MNTITLIGIVAILLVITIILLMRTYKNGRSKGDETPATLYWAVDCLIYNGSCWFDKQLTLESDPYETDQLQFMGQALVEQYMAAMHYPKGEYSIKLISPLKEDEYQAIRKDLFVTLHGYSYE